MLQGNLIDDGLPLKCFGWRQMRERWNLAAVDPQAPVGHQLGIDASVLEEFKQTTNPWQSAAELLSYRGILLTFGGIIRLSSLRTDQGAVAANADRLRPITIPGRDQAVCLVAPTGDAVDTDAFVETVELQFANGLELRTTTAEAGPWSEPKRKATFTRAKLQEGMRIRPV